jgi:hypothetical protein
MSSQGDQHAACSGDHRNRRSHVHRVTYARAHERAQLVEDEDRGGEAEHRQVDARELPASGAGTSSSRRSRTAGSRWPADRPSA